MDWTGSVAGRQYDRLAGVWLGGAEIFRTSTPEPDAGRDQLARGQGHQRVHPAAGAGPSRSWPTWATSSTSTYTGVYHMTMTFTYYQAQGRYPARRPRRPGRAAVRRRGRRGHRQRGWYTLGAGQSASADRHPAAAT